MDPEKSASERQFLEEFELEEEDQQRVEQEEEIDASTVKLPSDSESDINAGEAALQQLGAVGGGAVDGAAAESLGKPKNVKETGTIPKSKVGGLFSQVKSKLSRSDSVKNKPDPKKSTMSSSTPRHQDGLGSLRKSVAPSAEEKLALDRVYRRKGALTSAFQNLSSAIALAESGGSWEYAMERVTKYLQHVEQQSERMLLMLQEVLSKCEDELRSADYNRQMLVLQERVIKYNKKVHELFTEKENAELEQLRANRSGSGRHRATPLQQRSKFDDVRGRDDAVPPRGRQPSVTVPPPIRPGANNSAGAANGQGRSGDNLSRGGSGHRSQQRLYPDLGGGADEEEYQDEEEYDDEREREQTYDQNQNGNGGDEDDIFSENYEDFSYNRNPQRERSRTHASFRSSAPPSMRRVVKVPHYNEPSVLSDDASPIEFRVWAREFYHFARLINMQYDEPIDQQTNLWPFISRMFSLEISGYIDAYTPVIGDEYDIDDVEIDDGTVMAYIKKTFLAVHPIQSRRNDYYSLQQGQGVSDLQYLSSIILKAREGRIDEIRTLDDHCVAKFLGTMKNKKLKDEILYNCENPTMDDLKRLVRAYVQRQNTVKSSAGNQGQQQPQQQVAQVQASQGNKGGKNGKKNKGSKAGNQNSSQGKKPENSFEKAIKAMREKGLCFRCAKPEHGSGVSCPHEKTVCNGCNKVGHLKTACLRKNAPSAQVRSVTVENKNVLTAKKHDQASRVIVKLECPQGRPIEMRAIPDTGAEMSVITLDLLQKIKHVRRKKDKVTLTAANQSRIRTKGTAEFKAAVGSNEVVVKAAVAVGIQSEFLLSCDALKSLGLIHPDFPHHVASVSAEDHGGQILGGSVGKRKKYKNHKRSSYRNRQNEMMDKGSKLRPSDSEYADEIALLKKEFPDVFRDSLTAQPMRGGKMKITLKKPLEELNPKRQLTARPVPLYRQERAREVIDKLLKEGILLPVTEATKFLAPAMFVAKPNGDLRLVADLQELNDNSVRTVHPFPCAEDIRKQISPDAKVFAKLDCVQGYFQLALDEESSYLTTFLLPDGKFRFTRAPMGLHVSSDEWCRRSDEALAGLEGVQKIVDDILVEAPTIAILMTRVREVLARCREHNIIISNKKFNIGSEIDFAGYRITSNGIEPSPQKVASIQNFPTPQNITDLRSFLGLCNQLSDFHPDYAHMTLELRSLLGKNVAWQWLPEHQQAFEKVKEFLASKALLNYFDPNLKTQLLTDASRLHGIGFALIQINAKGEPCLIQCGSRSLNGAESRYATIELEALAIAWAVHKARHYLLGCPHFEVVTDHRPLVGIFKKPLPDIDNPRLQRFRERVAGFHMSVTWVPGKIHLVADALSRYPVFQPQSDCTRLEEELSSRPSPSPSTACIKAVYIDVIDPDVPLQALLDASLTDNDYQKTLQMLRNDVHVRNLPAKGLAADLKPVWTNLSILRSKPEDRPHPIAKASSTSGSNSPNIPSTSNSATSTQKASRRFVELICMAGSRIVPPLQSRPQILIALHQSHPGMERMKQAARQRYHWPMMTKEIEAKVRDCQICQEALPSSPEAPVISTPPSYPWETVGLDLFQIKSAYWIAAVDQYSSYVLAAPLKKTDTTSLTTLLESWFWILGVPAHLLSDNGPQFRHNFRLFCDTFGIEHRPSSPYHPASNGLAEAGVKRAKKLLLKTIEEDGNEKNFQRNLFYLNNTPQNDGISPHMLFFGRVLRSCTPALPQLYEFLDVPALFAKRIQSQRIRNEYADAHAVNQKRLNDGDLVRIQDPQTRRWDSFGTILGGYRKNRSFLIRGDDGSEFRRNRKFLRPVLRSEDKKEQFTPVSNLVSEEEDKENVAVSPVPPRRSQRLAAKN